MHMIMGATCSHDHLYLIIVICISTGFVFILPITNELP
jgi:hypothetical protein